MIDWKPWLALFLACLLLVGGTFVVLEIIAIFNKVPGDTLSARFMQASCIGVEDCASPDAGLVRKSVLALLLGIISLASWLIWHFYVEPVRYLKKHGKEIERS